MYPLFKSTMIDQFCTNTKKAMQVIIIKIHEENMHESLSETRCSISVNGIRCHKKASIIIAY